jgi:hypothetical protein
MGGSSATKGKGKENWIGWGVKSISVRLDPTFLTRHFY